MAHMSSDNYAAFSQVDYRIVAGLKAIAGLQYQYDSLLVHGQRNGQPLVAGDVPLFGAIDGTVSTNDNALTGRAGLQYEFNSDAQVYATYSRGFKGKGLGTEVNQDFVNQVPVLPERVNSYEIGFKGTTADHKLSANVAMFLADYSNLQIQANRSDPASGQFVFLETNAGKSKTRGIEVDATWLPTEGFSIAASATYVHARINAPGLNCPVEFQAGAVAVPVGGTQPDNTCFVQALAGGGVSGALQNVVNGRLPSSPAWRFSVNPRYQRTVGDYTAFAVMNVSYQSSQMFAVEQDPLLVQGSYAVVDLSVGFQPLNRGLSLTLFVKNLLDQHFYGSMGHNPLLTTATLTPNNLTGYFPKNAFRYVGATLGYSF